VALTGKFLRPAGDPIWVNVSGDTMLGPLTLSGDPTQPLHAATKQYIDAVAAAVELLAGPTGSQGPQGEQGEPGATWYVSGGPPTEAIGGEGDLYLNTVTTDVYQKTNGTWSVVAVLEGPRGPQGPKGDPGPDILTATDAVADFEILFDQDGDPLTEAFV
jgi:hypothetical protein